MVTIKIDGVDYPAKPSLGAMIIFKDLTGKEANELNGESPSEMAAWLYCCAKAECTRQKVAFEFSMLDFACALDVDTMQDWSLAVMAEADKKKKETAKK